MKSNRAHAVPLRLIDGPVVNTHRSDLVKRMAADLVRFDAFRNEQDAIRSLHGAGYSMGDIVMCVDDAQQTAFQQTIDIVAREMSRP